MLIKTSRFGDLEIDPAQIINFPLGLPGFKEQRSFIPMEYKEGSPFKVLQAIEEPDLAFVIINPFQIFSDYEINLSQEDKGLLEIAEPEDVNIYNIVSFAHEGNGLNINLQAPLVFNIKKNLGKQVVLHDSPYPLRYALENNQIQTDGK